MEMVWLYRNSMLLWRHVHLSVLVSGFWAFCLWLSSSTELTLFCCMKQIELLQMILWWNWCKGILVDLALFLLLSQNREVLFNLLEFGCKKWGFLAYGKLGQSTGGGLMRVMGMYICKFAWWLLSLSVVVFPALDEVSGCCTNVSV